ncbi:MAG TPA: hydrogenase maturation nickel metallochaperone HypA [Candidatus Acetothermia bacterium]|nr:hydrogenase maturation nickel metallochaperone HypA [Candidatus Acetothermia bacterium]
MHEYSIASQLVDALLPQLDGLDGRVVRVYLKKGELRILSDRALCHAFQMMSEGTRLEGAELVVEPIAVSVKCADCGYVGSVARASEDVFHFAIPILSCPACKAEVEILTGRELFVERISLEEPPSSGEACP